MSEEGNTLSQGEMAQMGQSIDNSSDDLDWDSVDEYSDSGDDGLSAEAEESEALSEDSAEEEPEQEEVKEEEESEAVEAKEESEENEEESEEESKPEVYEVKIDGKVQEVSLDELKENYSGKVAYDKKFTEVDNAKKSLEKQIEDINSYVSDLGKTMRNVSMLEGIYKIGELNSIGPHYIRKALIDELLPEINRLSDLSEDQRNLEYDRQDLDYSKKLQEKQAADFEQEQSQTELQNRIGKVMGSLGADNDEWNEAVDYLSENLPRSEELTPEKVGEYIQFNRAESRTVSELDSFQGGAFKNNSEVFDSLLEVIHTHPDFSSQDLQELLEEVYGASKQEAAEQKVEEVSKRKSSKTKKETINKKKDDSLFSEMDSDDWEDVL